MFQDVKIFSTGRTVLMIRFSWKFLFTTGIAAAVIFIQPLSAAAVTAIPPRPVEQMPAVSQPHVNESSESKSLQTVKKFPGVGRHDSPDMGIHEQEKIAKPDLNQEGQEGIKLPPLVENIGKSLKKVDESVLDVVEEPFKWLGLEAESAKLRPSGGGVGLDVSINLNKNKGDKSSKKSPAKSDSSEFYDLIKPNEQSHTINR